MAQNAILTGHNIETPPKNATGRVGEKRNSNEEIGGVVNRKYQATAAELAGRKRRDTDEQYVTDWGYKNLTPEGSKSIKY